MGTVLDKAKYPALFAAFLLIDNSSDGAEMPDGFSCYDVPDALLGHVGPAERALKMLQDGSPARFHGYVLGGAVERGKVRDSYHDQHHASFDRAHKLLQAYFNGWEPDYDRSI